MAAKSKSIREIITHHILNGCTDPRCAPGTDDPSFAQHLIEELYQSSEVVEHAKYARIENLVGHGWRRIPLDEITGTPMTSFSAGRNWMIDRIREALAGGDVSEHYPYDEDPRDKH